MSRVITITCILVIGAVGLVAAPASAAPRTVCAVGCDNTTITAAVAAASAGDTISIGAGTYNEHSILVNKPLTIIGAGIGSTIVDGERSTGYSLSGVFNVRARAAGFGTGPISISGLTVTNAGQSGVNPTGIRFAIYTSSPQATTGITSITFDDIKIDGTGLYDRGIYATGGQISVANPVPRQVPTLTVSNSTVSGTYYNGIGADTWNADFLVEGNSLSEPTNNTSSILIMNEYTASRMTAANVIRGNTSIGRLVGMRNDVGPTFGGYDSLTVTDNSVSGLTGTDIGIQVGTNALTADPFSRIGTATITNNTITGDGVSLGTRGVLIRGLVETTIVQENNITGLGTGISVAIDNGQSADKVQANRNRLFANNAGLANATTATVNANDNWWGCAAGPISGNDYCATATNTAGGTVDTSRWISASASAATSTLSLGDSTTVTGQFGTLNTGATIALPSFFDSLTATFTANTGAVAPSSAVLNGVRSAATTYTAQAIGTDEARVAIDRADFAGAPVVGTNHHYGSLVVLGEPLPVAFTVNPIPVAPTITSGTPSAPEAGAAYSFHVTTTGTPAPTLAVTSGTLPPGLTMSATGLISGIPTATGTFTFTITASNGTSPDATVTYTLNTTSVDLAVTGTNTAVPLALSGLLALIIGAGVTFASRSRRLRIRSN